MPNMATIVGKFDALERRTDARWQKFETDFGNFAEQVFGRFGDVVTAIDKLDGRQRRTEEDVRASLEGVARGEARQKKLESKIAISRVEVDKEIAGLRDSKAPPDGSGPLVALGVKAAELALQERTQSHHDLEAEAREAKRIEAERKAEDAAELAKENREAKRHRQQWAMQLAASLVVAGLTAILAHYGLAAAHAPEPAHQGTHP
jgi:hypothetical protein